MTNFPLRPSAWRSAATSAAGTERRALRSAPLGIETASIPQSSLSFFAERFRHGKNAMGLTRNPLQFLPFELNEVGRVAAFGNPIDDVNKSLDFSARGASANVPAATRTWVMSNRSVRDSSVRRLNERHSSAARTARWHVAIRWPEGPERSHR